MSVNVARIENSDKASYVVAFSVAATAAMDIFSAQAGAGKVLRLRRIVLVNPGSATGAILVDLTLGRSPAGIGSGGSSPGVNRSDFFARIPVDEPGGPDPAFPGTVHVGDTTQTISVVNLYVPLVTVSVPAAAAAFTPLTIYDARDPMFKPLTISGAQPTLVLATPIVGAGAANLRGYVEFTTENE